MIKAIIFDFDGVLVDTMPLHFKTWQIIARRLGFEIEESITSQLRGASRDKSLNVVLNSGKIIASESEKNKYIQEKDLEYKKEIQLMSLELLLPGAKEILDYLAHKNIKCAVASASKNARIILDHIGMSESFDIIMDANDIQLTKPDPAIFSNTISALGFNPDEVIIIEDSPLGIQAAKNINCICFGIGDKDKLNEADMVFNTLPELHKTLEKGNFFFENSL